MVPYLEKIVAFHSYSPGGDQPIKSIKDLNIGGPIIIVHAKKNPQISYNDAPAMYYALWQKKENVYLISKEGNRHIYLFDFVGGDDNDSVQNILAHHELVSGKKTNKNKTTLQKLNNISFYQPKLENHKTAYDELMAKERNHVWIKRGIWAVSIIAAYQIVKLLRGY